MDFAFGQLGLPRKEVHINVFFVAYPPRPGKESKLAHTLSLKRFTNIGILKRIEPSLLMDFLSPFQDFLVNQRSLHWPETPEKFDYVGFANILMSPSVDTPEPLLDALYYVDNLADPDCYDRILQEAENAGIEVRTADGEDPTPEDLALRVWINEPLILERIHAEMYHSKRKSFQSFYPVETEWPDLLIPSEDVLQALEADLYSWFNWKKKGRGARVFPFPREDGFWFLIRHGQRIKREETLEADESSGSVFYRPAKYDVLIYYPDSGELAIFTETKGEQQIYCKLLGKHLFGNENFFEFLAPTAKYTLEPMVDFGRDALFCGDVNGIDSIRLYRLEYYRNMEFDNLRVVSGEDVFRDIEIHGPDLTEPGLSLVRAKFKITFSDQRERVIAVEPPNKAVFDRETDSPLIHDWMIKRGFIVLLGSQGGMNHERRVTVAMG